MTTFLAKRDIPPRRTVRPPEPLADMPRRGDKGARPAHLVPVGDRLHAKDIALLEGFSPRTGLRLMASLALGRVHGRNARDRWVDRKAYEKWLLEK